MEPLTFPQPWRTSSLGNAFPLFNKSFIQYVSIQFLILGQKNMEIPVDVHWTQIPVYIRKSCDHSYKTSWNQAHYYPLGEYPYLVT